MPNPLLTQARGFLEDPTGTLVRGVNAPSGVPDTATQTTFGITLHAQVGNRRAPIGAVYGLGFDQTLQVDEVFSVDRNARGLPAELIPQTLTGRTIRLERYDLWRSNMEAVFGPGKELITLCDQTGPLSLRISWRAPANTLTAIAFPERVRSLRVYEFTGCYLTQLGRQLQAGGDAISKASGALVWSNVLRLA